MLRNIEHCEHLQACGENICAEIRLFNSKLTKATSILNNYEEHFKSCSDFLIYLKKNIINQVNASCLESLATFILYKINFYAERNQLCQKFIQMIGLIHRINPEYTSKGLEIFHCNVRHVFVCHGEIRLHDSYKLSQLRAFSMVLEGSQKFEDIIKNDRIFLLTSLTNLFSDYLLKGTTVIEKQTLYYIMKIILQLLQLNGKHDTVKPSDELFSRCFCISMAILKREDCTKDSQLVAASVVVELLKLFNNNVNWLAVIFSCFEYLLGNVHASKESTFSMGSIVLCGALLTHLDETKLSSSLGSLELTGSTLGHEFETFGVAESDAEIFDFQRHLQAAAAAGNLPNTLLAVGTKGLYGFIFEVATKSCRSSSHLHYQALKLLHQWSQMLPSFYRQSQTSLPVEPVRDEMLSLIMMHVESQIDGVNRNAVDLLVSLLDSFQRMASTDREFHDSFEAFKSDLYSQVLLFNWNIKSKYMLLGPLLDHVSISLEVGRLMSDLRKCLSTNHLVPCSTAIYKNIITKFKDEESMIVWNEHCCHHLINALTNAKSLERKNVAHYWLPITLLIIPRSLQSMMTCLGHLDDPMALAFDSPDLQLSSANLELLNHDVSKSSIVYARLRLLSAARMALLPYVCPIKDLTFAFSSSSNDLRLAALSLICISPSTTDCPTGDEVSLLKDHMSQQMSVDDPAFRKELEKCLRSICVRCRDHALMRLRAEKKKKGKEIKSDQDETSTLLSIDFMDFMWRICVENLSPNSNFQRSQSALMWMKIILGTFVSTSQHQTRKGVVPADVNMFIEAAKKKNCCNFFSESCTISLLSCIFSDIEQISEMSSEVLQLYFPWPLDCKSLIDSESYLDGWKERLDKSNPPCCDVALAAGKSSVDMDVWLLRESLILCNNFRSRESSCGVVLGGLVFSRCILEKKSIVELYRQDNDILVSKDSESIQKDILPCGVFFVEQLFSLISKDFQTSISDIVDKSSTLPLHGMILLMTKCLRKLPSVEPDDEQSARRMKLLIHKVVDFCHNVVDSILNIFGGRLINEATSPSFEQIDTSILKLIEDSRSSKCTGNQDEMTGQDVSRLHQIVTSWCWLNIKAAVLLLGELMKWLERNGSIEIGREEVQMAGMIFFKVLTQCRHRGAIESCTLGFLDFCSTAFHSSDKFFFDLPSSIINKVFDQLEALSDSSTTRRSAGLPSIIQTVLISEARCGQSAILKQVIRRLLDISRETSQRIVQEQRDHPRVHSMNILKTLVHESCLSDAMSQFLEPVVLCALDAFNSDHWMIRNAALQLFGSMVPRMLGEKTSSDETMHSMNSSEFLLRFPKFFQCVLQILNDETQKMKTSSDCFVDFCEQFLGINASNDIKKCDSADFSHSLVPILSLLSRLAPGYHLAKHKTSEEIALCLFVQNLCQSSMLVVRELSAKVVLALIHKNNLFDLIIAMVTLLPSETGSSVSANHVHGLLLQMLKLYKPAADCLSVDQMSSVRSLLETKSQLFFCPCLLIRAYFVKVIWLWHPQSTLLIEYAGSVLTKHQFRDDEIGAAFFQQTLANIWLSNECSQNLLGDNIAFCLSSNSSEVLQATLDWLLSHCIKLTDETRDKVVSCLWNLLENNSPPHWPVLCSTLRVLLILNEQSSSNHYQSFDKRWHTLKDVCDVAIQVGGRRSTSQGRRSVHEVDTKHLNVTFTPSMLALELLSRMFSQALTFGSIPDAEIMEKILSWSEMILWCSRCTKNAELRRSSVKACRIVVPSYFNIFYDHFHQHLDGNWMMVFVRLIEAGLTFLTDDDTDIRMLASEMISSVKIYKFNNGALPPSVHHEIAIKMWIEMILDLMKLDQTSVIKFLFNFVEENKTFENLECFHQNTIMVDEVFQAEDDNPYFEADQFHRVISEQLLQLSPIVCNMPEFLDEKMNSFECKIDRLMNLIYSMKSRSLELASDKKLYTCLSSVHWQHVLMKRFLIGSDENADLGLIKKRLSEREREVKFLMRFHKSKE